jgi:predicted transcriptional regulator
LKRDSIGIILEILRLVQSKPATITRIVYGTNLNHHSAEKYLAALSHRGFIVVQISVGGRSLYSITERGSEVLRDLENVLVKLSKKKNPSPES